MTKRYKRAHKRIDSMLEAMKQEQISPLEKVNQLKKELAEHYHKPAFNDCQNMGEILQVSLLHLLESTAESGPVA
jgi:hypothetical protein